MADARTVLVVEDNPELRGAIEQFLVQKGYRVVSTGDGLRAVQLAEQQPVDVVLVDLLIPGQSGFQVTLGLKSRFGDGVTVVVTSSVASPAHRDYAFAAGAQAFVPKPFAVPELVDAVAGLSPPGSPRPAPPPPVRIGA